MTNTTRRRGDARQIPTGRGRLGSRAHHGRQPRHATRWRRSGPPARRHGVAAPLVGDFHYSGHTLRARSSRTAPGLTRSASAGQRRARAIATTRTSRRWSGGDRPREAGPHRLSASSLDAELLDRLMDENGRRRPGAPTRCCAGDGQNALIRGRPGSSACRRTASCCRQDQPPQDMVAVYRGDPRAHPPHLGLTEAGMGSKGSSRPPPPSASCCRTASATHPRQPDARPGPRRCGSAANCRVGLRAFRPGSACPGCPGTTSTVFLGSPSRSSATSTRAWPSGAPTAGVAS